MPYATSSRMKKVAIKGRRTFEFKAPVVLMHMLGEPRTMQDAPNYENCLAEIKLFFEERIGFCERNGIARQGIIIDPGIGLGTRLQDNVAILRHLDEFR